MPRNRAKAALFVQIQDRLRFVTLSKSSLGSPMRLGRAKHLPVDSPSGCGCPSRAGMPSAVFHNSHKGHRPIVTAHRDGFSHDRRSLALGAIGHVWEANALACNAIEETCSRTALFREKTCLSSDRKAQFSLNRMLDGASERICPSSHDRRRPRDRVHELHPTTSIQPSGPRPPGRSRNLSSTWPSM